MTSLVNSSERFCYSFWIIWLSLGAVGCGSSSAPYSLTAVNGVVKYEDGSLIPADTLLLQFQPLAKAVDTKTHPRVGQTYVDTKTGAFDAVTTYKYADGLVRGKHKVVVIVSGPTSSKQQLVPKAFTDTSTTPLEVDTADVPLAISIPKP